LITARSYFFFVVVFVVLVVVVLEAVGVVLVVAVESIFIVVSIAAGAGAIAGADVSAVADSSFFAQAASTRTAATRARRFIYNLLWRLMWNKSPVRARDRGPVFGAGENLSLLKAVSRARPSGCPLMRGLD
jgi:enoyl-CoA hydratase/carnithine racemase